MTFSQSDCLTFEHPSAGDEPLASQWLAMALMKSSFGGPAFATSGMQMGCELDPEEAVIQQVPGSTDLIVAERMVQSLAVAGGTALAPESRNVTKGAEAVMHGLAQFMVEYDGTGVPGGPKRCGNLDLCSPYIILGILEASADNLENSTDIPSDLSLLSVAMYLSESLQIVYDSQKNLTGVYLLEGTGQAAHTIQSAWLTQAQNGFGTAVLRGDSHALLMALDPLSWYSLEREAALSPALPGSFWQPEQTESPTPAPTSSPSAGPTEAPTPAPTPSPTPAPTTPVPGPILEGRAIYTTVLAGCTVFADANGNGKLDDGEPFSETAENGTFVLDLQGHDVAPVTIEMSLDGSSACHDPVVAGGAPSMQIRANPGCSVISPMSTLLSAMTEGESTRRDRP